MSKVISLKNACQDYRWKDILEGQTDHWEHAKQVLEHISAYEYKKERASIKRLETRERNKRARVLSKKRAINE